VELSTYYYIISFVCVASTIIVIWLLRYSQVLALILLQELFTSLVA
jgi:hypothetical protein